MDLGQDKRLKYGKEVEAALDSLTSNDITKPLSANQGRVLKGLIDTINAVLQSDDGTLDELQEIVNYIKQNKSDLQNLSISNIAGLVDALALKETITGAQQKADAAEANANQYTDDQIANVAPKSKPEKYIDNSTQYTAIAEDKDKHLVFQNAINFIIPANLFAKDDEIEGQSEGGDVTVVEDTGMTVNQAAPLTKVIPRYGVLGLRFRTATKATLYGTLKAL